MAEFDYALPEAAIAQTPVEPRDSARLLDATGAETQHRRIADLPKLIRPGDCIVVNSTRVLPARLRLAKPSGGSVEVLLLEPVDDGWSALVRPSRRVAPGTVLRPAQTRAAIELEVRVEGRLGDGERLVVIDTGAADLLDALEVYGEVPLPPYIHASLDDPGRYQTVYADVAASVAAPTAGLHLTPTLLDECRAAGAIVCQVDLAVGLATFRPVLADRAEDHPIHSERFSVPDETMRAVRDAARVIAVGTTTVRALETAATGKQHGRTDLYIHGAYDWKAVDLLLTNFHMPRSSLLVMIASFVGPRWRDLYDVALAEGYRFLSFGDAMLLARESR